MIFLVISNKSFNPIINWKFDANLGRTRVKLWCRSSKRVEHYRLTTDAQDSSQLPYLIQWSVLALIGAVTGLRNVVAHRSPAAMFCASPVLVGV
jgi:hypothetical protein